MADNDKITLSYFDEFTDKQDLVDRWKNYFTKLGMVNDTASWDRFLNTNTQNLYIEAKYYGLPQEEKSLIRNPFFTFLKLFEDRNQKIDILTEKYTAIHNMVSKGVLSEKQISDTCPEEEQIRILFNKYLYQNDVNDFWYLIRTYNWILDNKIDNIVNNKFVLNALNKIDNEKNKKIVLIRLTFFTDRLKKAMEETKVTTSTPRSDELIDKIVNDLLINIDVQTSNEYIVSSQLVDCDTIEEQINWLAEYTQEGNRDLAGKQRRIDTNSDSETRNKNKKHSIYASKGEKQADEQRIRPELDKIKDALKLYSDRQLLDVLGELLDKK